MNIGLKRLLTLTLVCCLAGWHSSRAQPVAISQELAKQCEAAQQGQLQAAAIDSGNPTHDAYLFDCAVAVVISDPSPHSGVSKRASERQHEKYLKVQLADFFLATDIDVNYTNQYGDTLLMLVIRSFLPDQWKQRAVLSLLRRGARVDVQNAEGDTALSLAKYQGNPVLVKLLSQ